MHFCNAFLDGMWVGGVTNAFDGDYMFSIDTDQWGETGIDGSMVDRFGRVVVLRNHLTMEDRGEPQVRHT
jgi:hypothetical protein